MKIVKIKYKDIEVLKLQEWQKYYENKDLFTEI